MLDDYKYKKKKEVFDSFSKGITVGDCNNLDTELQEIKRNWFKVGIKTSYQKELIQKIIPILRGIEKKHNEEVSKIKNKYNNELDREVEKIKKNFLG